MPTLPNSPMPPASGPPAARKRLRKLARTIMKSYRFQIPKYDLPIRIRPWFIGFTVLVMMTLAFLGFTNSSPLPLNDKLLHFLCFCLATAVFYFIIDVDEDARRIWFWRYANIMFTGMTCMLFGGVLSEVVQSALPFKEFQFGDVVANLLGAGIGLYVSFHLEKYYRHRREINRLYRPLAVDDALSDPEDEDDSYLPTHYIPPLLSSPAVNHSNNGGLRPQKDATSLPRGGKGHARTPSANQLADVWDEGEELFGVGEDEDEEEDRQRTPIQTPRIMVNTSKP